MTAVNDGSSWCQQVAGHGLLEEMSWAELKERLKVMQAQHERTGHLMGTCSDCSHGSQRVQCQTKHVKADRFQDGV